MKFWKKSIIPLLLVVSPLTFAGTLQSVASFSVLADIVKQVGGEHIQVISLVGPDGDPHAFEPSPQDSMNIKNADLVFVSGLGLEGWMDRLIVASGYQGKIIIASTNIKTRKMVEDGETITDPHAWNSAMNGVQYARNVMNALITADPEDAEYFKRKGEAYIEKLVKLNTWAKESFSSIDKAKRKVLTSHDAFGYFGQEYGVEFLSPIGFSTEAEASASDVAELIQQLKSEHINAYFIENQTDPRLVEQIAKATGAKAGGVLFPEALTAADGEAPTYIDAFKHNVEVILKSMK